MMIRIALLSFFLIGCGGLDLLKNESSGAEGTPDGAPKSGCLQGAVIDGITGEQMDISTLSGDDGIFVRVRGDLKRGKAVGKGKENIRGEYRLCGVPLDETFPVVVRATGYQDFYSSTEVASTRAALHGAARHDIRSTKPTTIANIRLFPAGTLAKDFVIAVHHNGSPVVGAKLYLKANGGQIFNNAVTGSYLPPTGSEMAAVSGESDAAGLLTIPAANLVWGAQYTVLVMPPDTGRLKTARVTVYPGLRLSTGEDPYKAHVELPIADLQLIVVSRSLDAGNPSKTGSISYYFNRAIEQVPGTKDNVFATLTNAVTAALKTNEVANDASEQVTVAIDGNKLTLTPKFQTNPDEDSEPGLEITYSGVQVRPKEGEKRSQIIALADSVSFYGGEPTHNRPSAFTIVSGDDQPGEVFTDLLDPLVVNVKDNAGTNLQNIAVTWTVTDGGGSVSQMTTFTDVDGNAQVVWSLGSGEDQSLMAEIDGLTPLSFTARIRSIVLVSGDEQNATVSTALAEPLVVQLLDTNGDPVTGEEVVFTVTDAVNGGTLDNGIDTPAAEVTATTDGAGNATVEWTMGAVSDDYTVTATPGGTLTPVSFNATAHVEPVTLAEINATADPVVEDEEVEITVQINDVGGQPIQGVALEFAASENDSTVEATGVAPLQTITAVSGITGQVTVTWTIGALTGMNAQSLTVTVPYDGDVVPLVITKTVN